MGARQRVRVAEPLLTLIQDDGLNQVELSRVIGRPRRRLDSGDLAPNVQVEEARHKIIVEVDEPLRQGHLEQGRALTARQPAEQLAIWQTIEHARFNAAVETALTSSEPTEAPGLL